MRLLATIGCVVGLLSWGSSSEAGSASEPAVVMVLDASSSMLGKLGSKTKIAVARDVTHDLVDDWDPRVRLGLTAYGHRQANSCKDIEAVVPVSVPETTSFLKKVDAIAPKGKTPLTAALQNAADQLEYKKKKATVILLTDGIESCGGDPCALAKALKKQNPEFVAHVVGLGVTSKAEAKQLTCIAESTGGEYRGAQDADELKEALGSVVRDVERRGGLAPDEPGVRKLKSKTQDNVQFIGVRVPRGAQVRGDWSVLQPGKTKPVAVHYGTPTPKFSLPPGKYVVRFEPATTQVELAFEVMAGENHVMEVALNSGQVKFAALNDEEGAAVAASFVVKTADGSRKVASRTHTKLATFEIPAGKYQLEVTYANARVQRDFSIIAGGLKEQDVIVNTGDVWLTGVDAAGGPSQKCWFRIYPVGVNGKKASSDIRSAHNKLEGKFTLAEGRYVAVVKREVPGAKDVEFPFEIVANQVKQHAVTLPRGEK